MPFATEVILQVHMLIYTGVVPPVSICAGFLLASYFNMVDALVVHTWILHYNHNSNDIIR